MVALLIATPSKYHWYVGLVASVEAVKVIAVVSQFVNANCAPCAIVAVGTGLTVNVYGTLAALEQPFAVVVVTVNDPPNEVVNI